MKKIIHNSINIGLISLLFTTNMYAGDRDFTYTYQSLVLDKGNRELELWFTYLDGSDNFLFNSLKHRAEFEIGLGKHVQTAFYLNLGYSARQSATITSFDVESGVAIFSPYIQKDFSMSFSNEWKWQMSDPVANAIGSALYGEFTVGPDEFALEGKIILDKKIGNFVTALNLVGEVEYEPEITEPGESEVTIEWEKEQAVEVFYGLSYLFSPNFSAGIELKNKNEFHEGEIESVLYGGPAFSYKSENWWMAFTALPEIKNFSEEVGSGAIESRLIFSYHF